MSNNRILGNLANYIDSSSNGGAITKSGNDFFIQAMTDSDVGGTPATGIAGTDSASVKGLITTARVVQKGGRSKNAPGLKNVLQGEITKLNPSASATYNLGDSSNPIDEIILDSSATIFFGSISLTSILKSGTSTIATTAVAAAASPVSSGTVFSMGTADTNGLTNDSFVDRSSSSITLTSVGSPVQSSFNPYLDNWSVYFDGTGDYLSMPSAEGFKFGTGDFTIEGWMYFNTISTSVGQTVIDCWQGTNNYNWLVSFDADTFTFAAGNNGAYSAGNTHNITTSLSAGNWYHFAVTRESSSLRCFIDGVQQGSTLSNTANISDNIPVYIGTNQDGGGNPFNGYLSDIRIVKGTAVYTADFTPPTETLTAISGTELLTCQSNRFLDNSTNGHTITANGNAAIYSFNPYGQPNRYSLASNKGSFANPSGTNSYLTCPKLLPSDGSDCTVEFWFYWNDSGASTYGNDQGLFEQYHPTRAGRFIIWLTPSLKAEQPGSATITVSETIREKRWYHLAFVINSGTGELFLNGVSQGSSAGYDAFADTDCAIGTYNRSDLNRDYAFRGHISDIKVTPSAKYTADFTPPTEPLENTNATFYLPSDNAGIFDKSGANAIAVYGNAQTSTTQTKYSSTSVYFDGTGDYVSMGTDLSNLLTDFTIEGWFYFSALSSHRILVDCWASGVNGAWQIYWRSTGSSISFYETAGGIVLQDPSGSTISTDTWHHIAVSRSGSTIKLFIDGQEKDSATYSTVLNPDTEIVLGVQNTTGTNYFQGYMEDVRITKGVARYTANFTPPTAALEG